VVALRSEPKTLNPVTALDIASREVIGLTTAPLVRINGRTHGTEPALASSWTISEDGRRYTVNLRRGLRFSDGQPLDADDVVFSLQAYLDPANGSPQRDLLIVGETPIAARRVDAHTVALELEQPYAAAERLFDGIAILPRHRLASAQKEGSLARAWGLETAPSTITGLGPFRLKSHVPGERLVLERNPHYWKADRAGTRLPYLDEIVFLFVASEDAQAIRFQAGETDVVSRLSAENYAVLARDQEARGFRLHDLGPGLSYSFLFFNLNDLDSPDLEDVARRQAWFGETGFRQAVSSALDREGMVRLAYRGHASPLGSHVSPGNKRWVNEALPPPERSIPRARERLAQGGFSWRGDGTLVDTRGQVVEFSIVTTAGNASRVKMATVVQDDLRQLGARVHLVPLEQRALIDRILRTHAYDASVLALAGGDADPNPEMNVWLSSGSTHLWHPGQTEPATPWEAEIDRLMRLQMTTLDHAERKAIYDAVQALVAEHLPVIPLVSPNVLVGARVGLSNFSPTILKSHTLWNADELFWEPGSTPAAP
jgi:peptide/nickel transport system substrate-binding protein